MSNFSKPKTIAYFCSEYALLEGVSTYAGGLGVLAGEFVPEAGKHEDIRLHAFGLLIRSGKMPIQEGFELITGLISVPIGNRLVKVQAWAKKYGTATLYFLDPDVAANTPADRKITDMLYDADPERRVFQDMILGVGGVKLLEQLSIKPDIYHCNEGHTGFAALAAIVENGPKLVPSAPTLHDVVAILKEKIVATKHTILPLSDTYISKTIFSPLLEPYIRTSGYNMEEVYALGQLETNAEVFSMTKFLLNVAGRANGVSEAHVRAEKARFPQSPLITITNGVAPDRWQSLLFAINKDHADWRHDDVALVSIKNKLRSELVKYINASSGSSLVPERLTLVWARRFAGYKRPTLLLHNLEALLDLIQSQTVPLQIIVSGKVHADDKEGMKALNQWREIVADARFSNNIAYLPEYSLESARLLTLGADIWLNTPVPGLEACGTSGMKAGLNGAIVVSTNDGWVAEAPELEKIGFIVGEENIEQALYELLQKKITPLFGTPEWTMRMRNTIELVESRFTISRAVNDYIQKLY